MPQKRERESSPAQENESPEPASHGNKSESAEKASVRADELLEDIDRVLEETLGVGHEDLDEDERDKLAGDWVRSYVQKGGE